MRNLLLIITLVSVFSGQALGASLCPQICDSSQAIENTKDVPPCHQEKSKSNPSQEMPLDCEMLSLLNSIEVQMGTSAFSMERVELKIDDQLNKLSNLKNLFVTQSVSLNQTDQVLIGLQGPSIYLKNQVFRI